MIASSVCYLCLGCMTMQITLYGSAITVKWADKPSDGKMEETI